MKSAQTDSAKKRWFRFSLRSWFVLLSLLCIAVVLWAKALKRTQLEEKIIREGMLVYGSTEKHEKPKMLADRGGLVPRPPVVVGPSPLVEMRDSYLPWLCAWSKGSAAFCCFDSIEYHVGNVPMPLWVNEVLDTGELQRISLRVNEPKIDVNLVTKNYGLKELKLMGTAYDTNALKGIHRLKQLKELSIFAGFDVSFEKVLPQGLPPNLVNLHMTKCKLQSSDIPALKNCRQLESLTLRLGSFDLQALSDVGLPATLKRAEFYGSRIVKEDLELLADCPSLAHLGIGNNEIDLRDMDAVAILESVEYLDLRGASLDASTFRWLSKLPRLKNLDIRSCKFNDEDAEGIVLSPTLVGFKSDSTDSNSHVLTMLDKTLRQKKRDATN